MLAGRIGAHPPVRASTDDQVLREALADILEVVQRRYHPLRRPTHHRASPAASMPAVVTRGLAGETLNYRTHT